MCFDICTINIRVSIRVRGLHLVLCFFLLGDIASPRIVAMASDNLEDVLTKSRVDSNLTNSLMMEGWTSQHFTWQRLIPKGLKMFYKNGHPLIPSRPFRRPAYARRFSRFNLSKAPVLRPSQPRQWAQLLCVFVALKLSMQRLLLLSLHVQQPRPSAQARLHDFTKGFQTCGTCGACAKEGTQKSCW